MKGLVNLGNSCYFNSAIQCLLYIPQLTNWFIRTPYEGDCELTKEYSNLVGKMWSTNSEKIINPEKLLQTFKKFFKSFQNFQEQDCQEVFIHFLDVFDKSVPFTRHIFYSKMIQETICKSETSLTYESSCVHVYFIKNGVQTLDDIIKGHQTWNVLNDFKDSKDVTHPVATTRNMFYETSPILIFSFKIFDNSQMVNLPQNIDLKPYMHPRSTCKNTNYELFSTATYLQGHYVAFTKHKDNWMFKNDHMIEKIEKFPNIASHYLALYKLTNSFN